ncbi:hypothetical protein SHXM_01842 [Streptomyces hygroscopicus]|nr:hypothetical protein SHXM_01842 [Streptomyces hygroscopicus]
MVDRSGRVALPQRRFTGLQVHRPRRRRVVPLTKPLWIAGLSQPAHEQRDLSLGGLLPRRPQDPQQPVPPQQVIPIATARQRTDVPQHQIPQVDTDWLNLSAVTVHHDERKVGRGTRNHRANLWNRALSLHQGTPYVFHHTTLLERPSGSLGSRSRHGAVNRSPPAQQVHPVRPQCRGGVPGRLQISEVHLRRPDAPAAGVEQPVRLPRVTGLDQAPGFGQHETPQVPAGTLHVGHARKLADKPLTCEGASFSSVNMSPRPTPP